MSILINSKICDNAPECGGIEVCPVEAIFWNDQENKISIDNDKCINCGVCEKACPVGAIRFAPTLKEYERIKEEIRKDTRSEADLFVDRYGAAPVKEEYQKEMDEVASYLAGQEGIIVMELFKGKEARCLLESIPIKDLLKGERALSYIKVDSNDNFGKSFGITEFPSLIVIKDSKVINKIVGYYHVLQTKELRSKLQDLVK